MVHDKILKVETTEDTSEIYLSVLIEQNPDESGNPVYLSIVHYEINKKSFYLWCHNFKSFEGDLLKHINRSQVMYIKEKEYDNHFLTQLVLDYINSLNTILLVNHDSKP